MRLQERPQDVYDIPSPAEAEWEVGVRFRLNRYTPQGTRLVLWDAPPLAGTRCQIVTDSDAIFPAIAIFRYSDRWTAQVSTPLDCPLPLPHAFVNIWGSGRRRHRGWWEPEGGLWFAEIVPPSGVP